MDNHTNENMPGSVIVTLASSEYTIIAGASVEIAILLANPGSTGDYFKVNLLGIPQGWIEYSGPPATWVPAGGQEKVNLKIHPPASAEGATGSYLARLHVFSQSAPEQSKELEIQLNVLAEEKTQGTIRIRADSSEYKAIPGSEVKIPLTISNLSQEAETLELTVQGVPITWVSLPSPVINLAGGEQKSVEIVLQVPAAPEIRAGYVPMKLIVSRLNEPSISYEAEIKLGIAVFESLGRVGVMLSSVQFSAAPGSSLTIPITVLNRGLESDAFRLGVEGIPVSWVSTSTPVTPLEPGEAKEVTLVIRPPISSSSQAGRYKFFLLVASQKIPDQAIKVDCLLTVAAFTQFNAELEPKEVTSGQPVSVSVTNLGNTQQVFHLRCESQNDQLQFEFQQPVKPGSLEATAPKSGDVTKANLPGATKQSPSVLEGQTRDPAVLSIPAGESAVFRFTAQPRQRPFFGGAVTYPYQVFVKSQQQEAQPLIGQVIGRGMMPIWVLPIMLILCLAVFITAIVAYRDGLQTGTATQTWVAESTLLAGTTQTVAANQTAAAIAGELDTDGDGLTDQYEISINTNPYNPDSDGDRSWDGVEVQVGSNPMIPDTDADGLVDGSETLPCPSPLNPDSDQDGIIDGKDLNPCDSNNPAMTETAASLLPSVTPVPPTVVPTQTPVVVTPSPTSASLPRFGGVILFVSDRDGNPEIYNTDDAGHIQRMTDNPGMDILAAWDPAMQRIAFTSNRDGQNEIYVMNADGTNLVNLTNNPADDQQPAWSVDGQWLTFSSNRDGNYEIYILRLSDSEIINLTNNPGNDTQPNWVRSTTFDPLGESIVFTSDRDGNQEIYRMKTDGMEATNLTNNSASDQLAKGSPDGALVVFTTNRDGNQEIYTMRIDGAAQANQTNNASNDFGASWSSNQAWIAFTTDRDGNREVYIMKPGNLELYNLTNFPSQDQVTDWR
jgi:Tol biopolymer transport system component